MSAWVEPPDWLNCIYAVSFASMSAKILNPNYDKEKTYIARENRKEWDVVGLMGKLRIKKGQKTGANWIKMRDVSDTVEEWLVR